MNSRTPLILEMTPELRRSGDLTLSVRSGDPSAIWISSDLLTWGLIPTATIFDVQFCITNCEINDFRRLNSSINIPLSMPRFTTVVGRGGGTVELSASAALKHKSFS